jgi:hypothetical protein
MLAELVSYVSHKPLNLSYVVKSRLKEMLRLKKKVNEAVWLVGSRWWVLFRSG